MGEAQLSEGEGGLVPEGEGWFIVNFADAAGIHTDRFGEGVRFEGAERFPDFGINIRILKPGQPASIYHVENAPEAFLVLSGECVAVIDDEERPMRKGDFLYTPPGIAHVIVGAGEEPCSVLMMGARPPDQKATFPASEAAARYGASVAEDTDDVAKAYEGTRRLEPRRLDLPW
jgi:uncharacterized cupin superfamily protein